MGHHDTTDYNDLTGAIPELPASVEAGYCEFGEEGLCDVTEALGLCDVYSEHTGDETCAPDYASAPEFDITLVSCDFTSSTTDVGDITCSFTASGGAGHSITSDVYAASDCAGSAPTGVVQDDNPTFTLVSGDGTTQEESTYSATVSVANSAVPTGVDSIDFCLKVEVRDSDGYVYDWIGQRISLTVALDGTFSTESDLTTATFDGDTDVNDIGSVTFGVIAFRCDETGDATTDTNLALGENFFLCVERSQDTVIVNDITSLDVTKAGVPLLALITGGTSNSNTFVYGKGSEKVVVATRLPATFFEADGVVTLEGTADIERGVGSRKLAPVRLLQESPQSTDFSMTVEVDSSSAASVSAFGLATVFGLVVALVR